MSMSRRRCWSQKGAVRSTSVDCSIATLFGILALGDGLLTGHETSEEEPFLQRLPGCQNIMHQFRYVSPLYANTLSCGCELPRRVERGLCGRIVHNSAFLFWHLSMEMLWYGDRE